MNRVIEEFKPVRDKRLAIQNFNDVANNEGVYPMRVINQICRFSCDCNFIGDRAHCKNPYCFWGLMKARMQEVKRNNKQTLKQQNERRYR